MAFRVQTTRLFIKYGEQFYAMDVRHNGAGAGETVSCYERNNAITHMYRFASKNLKATFDEAASRITIESPQNGELPIIVRRKEFTGELYSTTRIKLP